MAAATARGAFDEADRQASQQFHDTNALNRRLLQSSSEGLEPAHEDLSFCMGSMKQVSFGGLDGVNTTFAVVAGAIGADLDVAHVLAMGFVCLFAGAFSMGLGECTSAKGELAFRKYERDREEWEMTNYEQGEIDEMVDIYKKKGMSEEHAKLILNTMAQYKDIFLDHMMVEELGILPPGAFKDPKTDGIVMFFSFAVFGLVPLLSFMALVVAWGQNHDKSPEAQAYKLSAFAVSCGLSALVLCALGAVVASYRKQKLLPSCSQMLFNGFVSGSVAYFTGSIFTSLMA